MLRKFIGDRAFYRRVLLVVLPIIIQTGISNFVSLLDNIMIGQVGTLAMSGVSIVNQLLFVFNLCIFGASAGAGIFTAQFHGSGNQDGIRHTLRFKVLICIGLALGGMAIFTLAGSPLVSQYLTGEGDPAEAAEVLRLGLEYLAVMCWGLVPFALSNAYASTLRETGQTLVPMVGGIAAVLVNLVLNYVLIFGHFGAPALGVQGAALATVISRYTELAIVALWTHLHPDQHPYIRDAFRSLAIPRKLLGAITAKGLPLLVNEFLWASGMAIMNQCYSTCGLDVVPAANISGTIWNLASVVFLSMGNCVGIIMGQMLGAGHAEQEIRDANIKLTTLSVSSGLIFGGLMALISDLFPLFYNTTDGVRALATQLILVSAAMMPFTSYTNAAYFTLRSGGQTVVTFLFDSCFVWGVCVPVAFLLSRFTDLPILPLYIICNALELLKCGIGWYMIRKGTWIQNLTK